MQIATSNTNCTFFYQRYTKNNFLTFHNNICSKFLQFSVNNIVYLCTHTTAREKCICIEDRYTHTHYTLSLSLSFPLLHGEILSKVTSSNRNGYLVSNFTMCWYLSLALTSRHIRSLLSALYDWPDCGYTCISLSLSFCFCFVSDRATK